MFLEHLFLYMRCPLRKGAGILANTRGGDGSAPLSTLLNSVSESRTLPRVCVLDINTQTTPEMRVIPDEDEFDIVLSPVELNSASNTALDDNSAPQINYAVAGRDVYHETGFFVSFVGYVHNKDNPKENDGYIFHFERDILNTSFFSGGVYGINGANILSARETCADVAGAGVLTGAQPLTPPQPQSGTPAEKYPARNISRVRLMAIYGRTLGESTGGGAPPAGVLWLVSAPIPYNGDGGRIDANQRANYEKLLRQYFYLSSATSVINKSNDLGYRVDVQKIYIVPEDFAPAFESVGAGVPVYCSFAFADIDEKDFPDNSFLAMENFAPYFGQNALGAPSGWIGETARRNFCNVSLGTPQARVYFSPAELRAGARLMWVYAGNEYSISIKTPSKTIDITESFVTPVLSNDAVQAIATQESARAISGIASVVSIGAGLVTGNPLGVIGGVLSGASLLSEKATQKETPPAVEVSAKAFSTLYGVDAYTNARGGIYWERQATANAQVLGRFLASYGENFTYTPVVNINNIFTTNGTGNFNCLYFKIAGGVLDGDISADDGEKLLTAFQNGVRIWKNWGLMKVSNYGN